MPRRLRGRGRSRAVRHRGCSRCRGPRGGRPGPRPAGGFRNSFDERATTQFHTAVEHAVAAIREHYPRLRLTGGVGRPHEGVDGLRVSASEAAAASPHGGDRITHAHRGHARQRHNPDRPRRSNHAPRQSDPSHRGHFTLRSRPEVLALPDRGQTRPAHVGLDPALPRVRQASAVPQSGHHHCETPQIACPGPRSENSRQSDTFAHQSTTSAVRGGASLILTVAFRSSGLGGGPVRAEVSVPGCMRANVQLFLKDDFEVEGRRGGCRGADRRRPPGRVGVRR